MLKTRIKTAAVLTAVLLPLLWFSDVPYLLSIFSACLSLAGTYELYRGAGLLDKKLFLVLSLVVAWVFPFLNVPLYLGMLSVVFPVILLLFLMAMQRMEEMPRPSLVMVMLLSFMVTVFFAAIPRLRFMEFGMHYLILFMLVCVATDTGAYFVGRAKGRSPLAATVSPKKTIEGALGGIVAALLVCVLFSIWVDVSDIRVNYAAVMLYGCVTSIVGQIGDLSMSVIKRLDGVKDFGHLLPGHGGILDRFDSQMFAAPFTLIFVSEICPLFVW